MVDKKKWAGVRAALRKVGLEIFNIESQPDSDAPHLVTILRQQGAPASEVCAVYDLRRARCAIDDIPTPGNIVFVTEYGKEELLW